MREVSHDARVLRDGYRGYPPHNCTLDPLRLPGLSGQAAGRDAEGGRGLQLVAGLAARWGWRRRGERTVTWFEYCCPADPVVRRRTWRGPRRYLVRACGKGQGHRLAVLPAVVSGLSAPPRGVIRVPGRLAWPGLAPAVGDLVLFLAGHLSVGAVAAVAAFRRIMIPYASDLRRGRRASVSLSFVVGLFSLSTGQVTRHHWILVIHKRPAAHPAGPLAVPQFSAGRVAFDQAGRDRVDAIRRISACTPDSGNRPEPAAKRSPIVAEAVKVMRTPQDWHTVGTTSIP